MYLLAKLQFLVTTVICTASIGKQITGAYKNDCDLPMDWAMELQFSPFYSPWTGKSINRWVCFTCLSSLQTKVKVMITYVSLNLLQWNEHFPTLLKQVDMKIFIISPFLHYMKEAFNSFSITCKYFTYSMHSVFIRLCPVFADPVTYA